MPAPTYKITNQEFGQHYNPDGTVNAHWIVHVEHENGTKATVQIPEQHYTPEAVHEVISAQGKVVDAVGKLPGSLRGQQ